MNVEQLKTHLSYLIDKYVENPEVRTELNVLLERDGFPRVKAIMAGIEAKGRKIEQADADLIKDIAFHYM